MSKPGRSSRPAGLRSYQTYLGRRNPRLGFRLLSPQTMMALALFQVVISFGSGTLGVLLGGILTSVMIWYANPAYLAPLMVCQLIPANFAILGHEGSATASNLINYFLSAAIAVRVSVEVIKRPERFRNERWLLSLWYVAMVPAVVMALMGYFAGNPGWSLPIRTVWLTGTFFYGRIVAERISADRFLFGRTLLPTLFGFSVLIVLGLLSVKLMFVLLALAFPVVFYTWRRQRWFEKGMSLVTVFCCALTGGAVGLATTVTQGADGVEFGGSGVGGATLTMNGLFIASIVLTLLARPSAVRTRRFLGRFVGWPAFALVVGASIIVAVVGPSRTEKLDAAEIENPTLRDKLEDKLFADRSKIWSAAWNDALRPPFFIKPSGTDLIIFDKYRGEVEWHFGAHNAVLNTLSRQRWLNGIILLILFGYTLQAGARGIGQVSNVEVLGLGVFLVVTGTIGVVANDYPLDPEAAFWFFYFGGVVAAIVSNKGILSSGVTVSVQPGSDTNVYSNPRGYRSS